MCSKKNQYYENIGENNELDGTAIGQYLIYAKKAREQGYEFVAQMFEEAYKSYLKDNSEYKYK